MSNIAKQPQLEVLGKWHIARYYFAEAAVRDMRIICFVRRLPWRLASERVSIIDHTHHRIIDMKIRE